MIPYGRQHIDDDDIRAVEAVLRGDFLTTGPTIATFEQDVASYCSASEGIAVSNGTAALHVAMLALGIQSGDEVIVPPMTFYSWNSGIMEHWNVGFRDSRLMVSC